MSPHTCEEMPFWQVDFLKSELSFSLILFTLPGCCYFMVRFRLKLPVSLLCLAVSSCLLYFSWEFFNLYLFILEGSDSLVSVCGRELRDVAAMTKKTHTKFMLCVCTCPRTRAAVPAPFELLTGGHFGIYISLTEFVYFVFAPVQELEQLCTLVYLTRWYI